VVCLQRRLSCVVAEGDDFGSLLKNILFGVWTGGEYGPSYCNPASFATGALILMRDAFRDVSSASCIRSFIG
jgi:hypothetical protein